ncbi:MAG TPA: hypothetical protein VL201_02030 [Patescibacteria group bacterium]|nr:hypothetical protein [Patescibacteria group bacterium]
MNKTTSFKYSMHIYCSPLKNIVYIGSLQRKEREEIYSTNCIFFHAHGMEQLCDAPDTVRHLLSFISPKIFNDLARSDIRPFNDAKQEINNVLYFSSVSKKNLQFFYFTIPI